MASRATGSLLPGCMEVVVRVLIVTAELAPLAEAGGVAQYSMGLARASCAEDHDVHVALPSYGFRAGLLRAVDTAVEIQADEDLQVMFVAEALRQENEWRHRAADYISLHEGALLGQSTCSPRSLRETGSHGA